MQTIAEWLQWNWTRLEHSSLLLIYVALIYLNHCISHASLPNIPEDPVRRRINKSHNALSRATSLSMISCAQIFDHDRI
jgi:hypothetical protein